jgi:hypothetical protein
MRYPAAMNVQGTFAITSHPEPPYDVVEGVALARMRFAKRFAGPLDAASEVHMLAARTPVPDSAGYMTRGARALRVTVVPDSGTGELAGLTGEMDIEIVDGQHHYRFDFDLPPAPGA